MDHSFDVEVAKQVGVNAAILYRNIQFWCAKNKANDMHFHDGYYWTYNSKKAFAELFPYFTERQVEYALNKLIEAGYIKTGNYNKSPFDKTLWYTDCYLVDSQKLLNQGTESVEAIPYNKQQIINNESVVVSKDTTTSNRSDIIFNFGKGSLKKKNLYEQYLDLINDKTDNNKTRELFREWLNVLLEKYKDKGKTLYVNVFRSKLSMIDKFDVEDWDDIIEYNIRNGYEGFYPINTHNNSVQSFDKTKSIKISDEDREELKRIADERERNGQIGYY